ncbi:MAG: hypothetical protein ACM33T_06035 [Solirubrobacterales bacterium]
MNVNELKAGQQTLTREQLYSLVWSEPIQRLAARFGISDVGLAKNCRAMHIPLPPRGYWAKLKAGQKPLVTRLLSPPKGTPLAMTVRVLEAGEVQVRKPKPKASPDPEVEAKRLRLPASLEKPHPLVRATEAALLKQAKKDPDGMLYAWGDGVLDVRGIGVKGMDRALLILDVIAKAVEARGHEIVFRKGKPCVKVGKHEVEFYLSDLHETHPHVVTAEEKVRQKKEPWFTPSKYESRPSGNLVFHLDDQYAGAPRKSWRDGKRQRLDNLLDDIVEAFEIAAACIQAREDRWERERQESAERERRRHILEQRQREENARVESFVKAAENWDLGKKLDAYADAVEQSAKMRGEDAAPEVQRWLAWARAKAAQLDPLRKDLPRRKAEWDEPPDFSK